MQIENDCREVNSDGEEEEYGDIELKTGDIDVVGDGGEHDDELEEGGREVDVGADQEMEAEQEEESSAEEGEIMETANSSEPSSSTDQQRDGTERHSGGSGARAGAAFSSSEQGKGEDSVVTSTPNLPLQRRGDGFAEAVSSPQAGL